MSRSPSDSALREFEAELAKSLRPMFRFAASLVGLDDAEDVVQDALVRAWAKRAQFDPRRGTVESWVLGIVADQARQRWRHPRTLFRSRVELIQVTDVEPAMIANADLRHAVTALPSRQRETLLLFYWVDLPIERIAELMHCSPGTVKSTLHDARQSVGRKLGDSYARC